MKPFFDVPFRNRIVEPFADRVVKPFFDVPFRNGLKSSRPSKKPVTVRVCDVSTRRGEEPAEGVRSTSRPRQTTSEFASPYKKCIKYLDKRRLTYYPGKREAQETLRGTGIFAFFRTASCP